MLSIITSYLLQSGKCSLPYLGVFNVEYKPAVSDIVNRQMLPPSEEIFFREGLMPPSPGLVKYVALNKNITENDAEIAMDNFLKELRQKIESGEVVNLEAFGTLYKNESGNIIFSKENGNYNYQVIPANRVVRENAEHTILVGARETTSVVMNKYYSAEAVSAQKRSWFIWALILLFVSLAMLIYIFYGQRFSPSSIGNKTHFIIKTAAETHFDLSK